VGLIHEKENCGAVMTRKHSTPSMDGVVQLYNNIAILMELYTVHLTGHGRAMYIEREA
jgi:hypothetical protein